MKEKKLSNYVLEHGQTATARGLGLTQGAVWQMLRAQRSIYVATDSNGQLEAYEKKPIGRKAA